MTVLQLKRVDMGSAATAHDRPIWINASATEWFELEHSGVDSVMMVRNGERVPVRKSPRESSCSWHGSPSDS